MPITLKQLHAAEWKLAYRYDYADGHGACFKTFSCPIPSITVTHDRKIGSKRTIIYYTVHGQRTDSPTEAVRLWNRAEQGAVPKCG